MKVLVVGKGGREHAIITALNESPTETEIIAFPGSDAIFEIASPAAGVSDLPTLSVFMVREGVELCVAGEESYLVTDEGLANACEANGIPCWGPPKEAAQLEASKEFAKEFMLRHKIPTGGYSATESAEEAHAAVEGKCPIVLKFDGLAAGKGVAVCMDEQAAHDFVEEVLEQRKFGAGRMLIEEFLEGPEISIFVSVVGGDYQILAPARDYKRIFDGDGGPNTGGMGAVSSREMAEPALMKEIDETIIKPTIDGLIADGLPYRGFLYFGIMLTPQGPKILEYNCRFGDPEAEAVLPMVQGDFAAYVMAGARGELKPDLITFRDGWSICLVSASAGYPASSRNGDAISGLEDVENARVFHSGTRKNDDGVFETNGGRVLVVTAHGDTRADAVAAVYRQSDKITFDDMQRRSDIGVANF